MTLRELGNSVKNLATSANEEGIGSIEHTDPDTRFADFWALAEGWYSCADDKNYAVYYECGCGIEHPLDSSDEAAFAARIVEGEYEKVIARCRNGWITNLTISLDGSQEVNIVFSLYTGKYNYILRENGFGYWETR